MRLGREERKFLLQMEAEVGNGIRKQSHQMLRSL